MSGVDRLTQLSDLLYAVGGLDGVESGSIDDSDDTDACESVREVAMLIESICGHMRHDGTLRIARHLSPLEKLRVIEEKLR